MASTDTWPDCHSLGVTTTQDPWRRPCHQAVPSSGYLTTTLTIRGARTITRVTFPPSSQRCIR